MRCNMFKEMYFIRDIDRERPLTKDKNEDIAST